jgi:HK97 family phage portal protein
MHFRNLESDDKGIGLSTIAAARNTFGLSMASEEASSGIFKNGMIAPGFLAVSKMDPKARENFKKSFEDEYAGGRNAFKLPLIPAGEASYVRTGLTAQDVQFIETRRLSLLEIALMFGVPAQLLGFTDAGKTSSEQQAISFLVYSLQPLMANIEAEYNHTLLSSTERKTYSIRLNPDSLLRTDQKSRYEAYASGVMSGTLKPSEARRKERLPHDPAGDDLVCNAATVKLKDAGVQWTGNKNKHSDSPDNKTDNAGDTTDE